MSVKVLILNYSDTEGGAARGARRLHEGLKNIGVESLMFVMSKKSDDPSVIAPGSPFKRAYSMLSPYIDALPVVYLYRPAVKPIFSSNWFPNDIYDYIEDIDPDIVHLRWVGGGFLNYSVLNKIKKPVVWTLPDSWAFTGGCHVPFECERYISSCGACPQLESSKESDLSRRNYNKKKKAYGSMGSLTVVCPSRWLADCAKKSSLFRDSRVEVIPNGIPHDVFKPMGKELSRRLLKLPDDKKLIFFGAVGATSDRNKGFHLLVEALKELSDQKDSTEVVVFGASEPQELPGVDLNVRYIGFLYDNISMALLYSAADVMVVPSIQENFPLTAFESGACGTPVVAFEATGVPDVVEHEKTGYLARPYDPSDLANGIKWVLADEARHIELSANARRRVEERFTLEICARKYLELYKSL